MRARKINVVWLKRDLRVRDHAPLHAAATAGQPYVLLYCWELELLNSEKHSARHWRFVAQSLDDLRQRGWPVLVVLAEPTAALAALHARYGIDHLFSHQETGNKLTFDRDRRVRSWCRKREIPWREFVQDGVIRGRKHRIRFKEKVDAFLARPQVPSGDQASQVLALPVPDLEEVTILPSPYVDQPCARLPEHLTEANFQPGGESLAWRYLRSFTAERGRPYARQLGSPSLSRRSCSRISPYLAWGCVSVRQVHQWTLSAKVPAGTQRELERFRDRLWWRAHYYQKLEAEWQLEFRPINRVLAGLERGHDPKAFQRWATGNTGLPMVDAAMRCLRATGWLNFRMRAMLVTFATFALWQDWRPVSAHLGRLFLDYDPGIHYAQHQMQAGLTGYHVPRHFNPYLQGEQYDPDGVFVHRWVPELQGIPAPWCHYPHRLTVLEREFYGFTPDRYPAPMVDYDRALKENQARYWGLRSSPEARALLPAIWAKHCLPEDVEKYMVAAGTCNT